MSRLRVNPRRSGTFAILVLGFVWAFQMHSMGWAQSANFAQVRALAAGQAAIDPWHWETKDKAWVEGHFYSVKAPGLAALTLPLYAGLEAIGGSDLSASASRAAASADHPQWVGAAKPPYAEYGFSEARAEAVEEVVIAGAPMVWALTLLGAVIPATLLLFLVRRIAERIEPGYGAAAAITLGMATIVMTFASEFFPHVIAAALGLAAFAVLTREREGGPRIALAGAAGLIAGVAVSFEYQMVLVGIVLFGYLLASPGRVPRGTAYAAGAVLGAIPAMAFNWWALGSPLQFAYADAVAVQGFDGHLAVGLNDDGLFGIQLPNFGSGVDLLLGNRGLLTLTPVIAMGVAGAVWMRRRGFRAESAVILAVAAVFFIYNAGYWLPFGGGSPGPRFLIPALPFVALGFATAYRRMPAVTLALAIPSAVFMVAAAVGFPLIGENGAGTWLTHLVEGDIEHTFLTVLGVDSNYIAAIPVVLGLAAVIVLAVAATQRARLAPLGSAVIALTAWVVVSVVGPTIAGSLEKPLSGDETVLGLIGIGALAAAIVLAISARQSGSGRESEGADDWVGDPAASGSIS